MNTPVNQRPALDEEVWSAWERKNELRDIAKARKYKKVAVIIFVLLILGAVIYLRAPK